MISLASAEKDGELTSKVVEATVRIALIVLLAGWCFVIVQPFIVPVVWGIVIAVASYPGYLPLRKALGGRSGPAAVLFVLLGLLVLIVPAALLSGTLVEGAQRLAEGFGEGSLRIPPPPPSVGDWPLIGNWLARFWGNASENLAAALAMIGPQLKVAGRWLLATVAGVGFGILQFVFAIAIAGVLLTHADAAERAVYAVARRLARERGVDFAVLAGATVRSVTRGILGVALIQSLLAGIGFLVAGVPGAGLWALLALLLSIVQIGIFPVAIPAMIYVFYTADTLTAVLFLIWSLLLGSLDNVLKPILLGRGVAVPMAVIFIGAIGGFLSSGIIGLFVGAVVLVLGYKLFLAWLYEDESAPAATAAPAGQPSAEPRPEGGRGAIV